MFKLFGRAVTLAAVLALAIVGCGKKQAALPPPQAPLVDVDHPILRSVTDYEYFTGRTELSEMVEIRARVAGYLTTAPVAKSEAKNGEVKEGDDVEKGRLLFEIDRRTFVADKERAEASIKQLEALTDRLERDYRRARDLSGSRAMSREEQDKVIADRAQAKANLKGAQADLAKTEINLDYTRIKAPFSGRISRRSVDVGNLVKADDTVLTTIVKLDPIQAYFDVDERTVLRFRDLLRDRQITSARQTPLKVRLAMANEKDYKREGVIDFVDNRLEAGTGTLRIRVELSNPKTAEGFYYLSPGMFIRLRLPVGNEHQALLVPEAALASKQGQKVVYVVRSEAASDGDGDPSYTKGGATRMVDRVYEIPVEPGHLEEDNWRVIKSSGRKQDQAKAGPGVAAGLVGNVLKPDDRIVVSGLQRVRDKGDVRLAPPKKDEPKPAQAKNEKK